MKTSWISILLLILVGVLLTLMLVQCRRTHERLEVLAVGDKSTQQASLLSSADIRTILGEIGIDVADDGTVSMKAVNIGSSLSIGDSAVSINPTGIAIGDKISIDHESGIDCGSADIVAGNVKVGGTEIADGTVTTGVVTSQKKSPLEIYAGEDGGYLSIGCADQNMLFTTGNGPYILNGASGVSGPWMTTYEQGTWINPYNWICAYGGGGNCGEASPTDCVYQIEGGQNQHTPFATSFGAFANFPNITHPCYGGSTDVNNNKQTCLHPSNLGSDTKCKPSAA